MYYNIMPKSIPKGVIVMCFLPKMPNYEFKHKCFKKMLRLDMGILCLYSIALIPPLSEHPFPIVVMRISTILFNLCYISNL